MENKYLMILTILAISSLIILVGSISTYELGKLAIYWRILFVTLLMFMLILFYCIYKQEKKEEEESQLPINELVDLEKNGKIT